MRRKLILWLFENTRKMYVKVKRKDAWTINQGELLTLPSNSLGYALGAFLAQHGFSMVPKVEEHDVFHVLFDIGTEVEDELALQFLCYGNGKWSLYLVGSLGLGLFLFPEYYRYFWESYQRGRQCRPFTNTDFRPLLELPLDTVRASLAIRTNLIGYKG